ISLLNPASAFVRAVKGIIDIVTFIVNQGAQIVEFVNSVLDAVIAIANGGAAGVPKMVEAALAASVPLLIGFLASLLGIGSLANKVKSVFHAVSRPVNRAIDKIVGFIAKAGKKLWDRLKRKGKEKGKDGKGGGDLTPQERATQLRAGLAALDNLTGKYRAGGATERQMRGELKRIKKKHTVFKELSASKKGDAWEYRYVASPPTQKPGPPSSSGSFSHAPGGLAAHEGHTIRTSAKPKTIHLIQKHGQAVTEAMMKQRLTDALQMFKDVRKDKKKVQQDKIDVYDNNIAELQKNPQSPKRDAKISKIQDRRAEALQLIADYDAINEGSRDEVFAALDKWAKSLPHMVSKEVTHFTDDKMMESVIKAAIAAGQARIDAALTDSSGNPKGDGAQGAITHPAPPGLGEGYELDRNNLVVPISRPLTKVVLRLVVSDSVQRHFMIETAYFE
ncbi:hypothetical protein ACWCPY_38780, partial [Streptomyces sp. NPDC002403]